VVHSGFEDVAQTLRTLLAAAGGLAFLRLSVGQGVEFRATAVSTEVKCLPIALDVNCGRRINDHTTDGIFGGASRGLHYFATF